MTLVQSLYSDNTYAIFFSVYKSNDEVGSSNKIILDFFNKALINDILCFYPPEKMFPFSPTLELYPFGSFMIV